MYVSTNQLKIKKYENKQIQTLYCIDDQSINFFRFELLLPKKLFLSIPCGIIHRFVWALITLFCLPLSHSFHFVSVRESFLIHFAFCFISFCLFMCVKYHVSTEEFMQEWSMKNWLQFQHFTLDERRNQMHAHCNYWTSWWNANIADYIRT